MTADVAKWLAKVRDALSGEDDLEVRSVLMRAMRSRARVELEPLTVTSRHPGTLTTRIEKILDDAFVVSQPVVGGVVRPLARFEPYRLVLAGPRGKLISETQALGRIKVATSGEHTLYGYRMAIPGRIQVIRRRRDLEAVLGRDTVREGELLIMGHHGPILGLVEELSPTGARLLCRNGQNHVQRGQDAFFKLEVPDPVGTIHEMANVIDVQPDPDSACLSVRIAFDKRNEMISDALRRSRAGFAGPKRRSA